MSIHGAIVIQPHPLFKAHALELPYLSTEKIVMRSFYMNFRKIMDKSMKLEVLYKYAWVTTSTSSKSCLQNVINVKHVGKIFQALLPHVHKIKFCMRGGEPSSRPVQTNVRTCTHKH